MVVVELMGHLYNVFITTFYDEKVKEVDKALRDKCDVIYFLRSRLLKEFYHWRVKCDIDLEEYLAKLLEPDDKIVWFKVEKVDLK